LRYSLLLYPTADAAAIAQLYQDAEMDGLEEDEEAEESLMGDDDQDNDPQEGTSTAVRVKKVGKKRAEKLKRKEHMRQYREVSTMQVLISLAGYSSFNSISTVSERLEGTTMRLKKKDTDSERLQNR
jgi:hypothetical protein